MPDEQVVERAPYLSLTTLLNFLDRWGEGPIPPRIDKSALDNYSGGTQAILMTTLRQIGYVDGDGRVTPALRESISDQAARKAHLTTWARRFYAEQIALAEEGATAGMLQESFAAHSYSGSTLRKAIVFYLALVEYLSLPNSPHFRAPKQSATPSNRKRLPRGRPTAASSTPADGAHLNGTTAHGVSYGDGETAIVRIGSLATITITVDAQWMKLPVETITTMRQAIAQLEALNTSDDAEPE